VPWIVWGFFKLITPFIDPLTREKLKFNEDMTQYVPAEQLWTEYPGGKLEFEYDHEVYWPALIKMTTERREEQLRRWEAGGKLIGEHEDYLKGAAEVGASGSIPSKQAAVAEAKAAEEPAEEKVVSTEVPTPQGKEAEVATEAEEKDKALAVNGEKAVTAEESEPTAGKGSE
jgi:hypothetical protein